MGNSINKCFDGEKNTQIKIETNKKSFNQSIKGSLIKPGGSFMMRKEPILDDIQTQMYESGMRKVICNSEKFQEKINKCIRHLITQNHRVVCPISPDNHIYQIEDTETGLFFAIKFIDQSEKQYKDQIQYLETFMQIQDTHSLVRIIEYSNIKRHEISYQIMELCESNLESIIEKKEVISLQDAINITMKLFSLLIDIHSSDLSHLCIEPKKILIDGEDNFKLIGLPKIQKQKIKKDSEIDLDEDDQQNEKTYKAPEQVELYEKVKQGSFFSNNSKEDFKMTEISSQQKTQQDDLKQKSDIFSMGMVILSVIGANINKDTAAEIRAGQYQNIQDMKELNPLVSFIIHFMLQIDPLHRYSAIKLQSEILIHFYKLNVNDNFKEIERINNLIQNEDQLVDSQLNLSRYYSQDFGECSQFSARKSVSKVKLQISKKLAYLQFNYYLQHIKSDKSDFAKKAIILAKNTQDFKKEDIFLFEYYFLYRNCVQSGWVYSQTFRNSLEENYKKRQILYQNYMKQNQQASITYSDVIDSLSALANSMLYSFETQSSIQYLQEVLEFRRSIYQQKNHPEIAQTLNDLGDAYCQIKDYKEALTYYNQALEIRKQLYNNQSNQFIFTSLFNLSKIYYLIGDEQQAIKLDQEAQQMSSQIVIKPSENQQNNMSNSNSMSRQQQQQNKKSANINALLQKAFPYPRINPFKAEIFESIILENESINQFDVCLFYNEYIIEIYTSLYGENHLKSFQRIQKQGEYYKKKKNYKESLKYIQRAMKIAIRLDLLSKKELQFEYELLTKYLKN